jgi:cytidine deaminase
MSTINFEYKVFNNIKQLSAADAKLLKAARSCTKNAYAPYSNFKVGAAGLLKDGTVLTGVNQENASYPTGICAERTLLSAVANSHVKNPVITMAISYQNKTKTANKPISPCGVCRQSLLEYCLRYKIAMRIILAGQTGDIYIIEDAKSLLPLQFDSANLK